MATTIKFGIKPGTSMAGLSIEGNNREIEYTILFSEPVEDTEDVLLAPDVPFPGDPYPFNDTMRCTSVSVSPNENNQAIWNIKCTYDASGIPVYEGAAYDFSPGSNPITKVATGAYIKESVSGTESVNDLGSENAVPTIPIVNSADDPFSEPLTIIKYNPVFSWWQVENEAFGKLIESGEYSKFIGTINRERVSFCGRDYPAGYALIKNIEPSQYYYRSPYDNNSVLRWRCTYTIEINDDGWGDLILDQGYDAYLKKSESDTTLIKRPIRLADLPYNTTGSKVKLSDANDDYVQNAVKLDGYGKILDTATDPVYIQYLVKRPLYWDALSLATEIAKP